MLRLTFNNNGGLYMHNIPESFMQAVKEATEASRKLVEELRKLEGNV